MTHETAQTREALVELMARAMCVYQDQDPDRELESVGKDGKPVTLWKHWRCEATAALLALEAAGVRLVPVEATLEMRDKGRLAGFAALADPAQDIYGSIFRAMLSASPYAKGPTND
jgi:hypothetical protein